MPTDANNPEKHPGPGLFRLRGRVQHYAWGGFQYLPHLLGRANDERVPHAEYWLGTHPRGPASVRVAGVDRGLADLIAGDPGYWLGADVARAFGGSLPFLFKILDVRKMLSIQAHPDREQARAGFAREQAAGIPLDAPHRVFRDANHKPELMVALSPFWLLHGFRATADAAAVLRRHPALRPLAGRLEREGLPRLYRALMTMPQPEVNRWLAPLREALDRAQAERPYTRDQPEYWARAAFRDYVSPSGDLDRGLFSIFLLNLVYLAPGQGIFQAAGVPHAYLAGQNVELMANSDNVLRGGLTAKHIDPTALMDHLVFDPVRPQILGGTPEAAEATGDTEATGAPGATDPDTEATGAPGATDPGAEATGAPLATGPAAAAGVAKRVGFPTPARDFELSALQLGEGAALALEPSPCLRILLVIEGAGHLVAEGPSPEPLGYQPGAAFLVAPGRGVHVRAAAPTLAYLAGVPPSRAS